MTKPIKSLIFLSALATAVCVTPTDKANAMVATNQTTVESVASTAAHKDGWEESNGKYYYYKDGQIIKNTWFSQNGYWYYATSTGAMKTGWFESTGKNGGEKKYWFYFDNTGKMKTGLQKIGKYYYYFYTKDKEYKDAPVGAMLYQRGTTSVEIDKQIHMFNEDGQAYSGWIDWGDWYYFSESGVPAYGLKTINNKKYLFVDSHSSTVHIYTQNYRTVGYLAKNQWVIINDKYKYYANEKGIAVTGWKTIDDKTYYFNTDGKLVSGWKQINNNWYFFANEKVDRRISDRNYGERLSNRRYEINKKWYSFNTKGVMQTGWVKEKTSNGDIYFYYNTTTGVALTGWQTVPINNSSTTKAIYYFAPSGRIGQMYTGLQTINGKKYYFGKTYGKLTYGWQQIDGKWYYFDKANKGAAVVNTSKKIGNKTYKFNKNGVCTNK